MRISACFPWMVLALWGHEAEAADVPRDQIAIVEFSGSQGATCHAAFQRLVADRGLGLVELGDEAADPPDAQDFAAVTDWLQGKEARWPRAGLVLLGSAHGARLVLGVYSLPEPALVGLETFPIEKGCRMNKRGELIVGAWLESLAADDESEPAVSAAPAAGSIALRPPASEWSRARRADVPNLSGEDPLFPTRATASDPHPLPKGAKKDDDAPSVEASSTLDARELFRVGEPEWIGLSVEMKAVTRSFQFVHLPDSTLRGYELDLAPALGLSAQVHPLAALEPSWLRGFGVHLDYWAAIGLESERTEGGAQLPSELSELELGARYDWDGGRFLPGLRVSPLVAFHQLRFATGSRDGQSETELPDMRYQSLRLGAAGSIPIRGRVVVNLDVAYLLLLSTGDELESPAYFSEASGFGFDLVAGIAYQLNRVWSFHASAEFLSYSIDLSPSSRGAVGVDEEVLAMSIGARVRY